VEVDGFKERLEGSIVWLFADGFEELPDAVEVEVGARVVDAVGGLGELEKEVR
jgi:hypothetical protein